MKGLGIPIGLILEVYKVGKEIYDKQREKEAAQWQQAIENDRAEIVKINGYDTMYNGKTKIYTVITPEVRNLNINAPFEFHGRADFYDKAYKSGLLNPYMFYIDTNTKQVTPVYPEAAAKVWGTDPNGNRVITSTPTTTNNSSSNKKKVNIIIIAVAAIAATYLILKD